jgi:hypothetical protein
MYMVIFIVCRSAVPLTQLYSTKNGKTAKTISENINTIYFKGAYLKQTETDFALALSIFLIVILGEAINSDFQSLKITI